MASLTSALRRLARLEQAQPQPTDIGKTRPAPPLSPEQQREVLRMLAEAGGLQGERFAAVRAALQWSDDPATDDEGPAARDA